MNDKPGKTIGDLNGWWALLLKVHLAVVSTIFPLILLWCIWLTQEAMSGSAYRNSGERFTQEDGRRLEDRAREAREALARSFDARLDTLDNSTTRILTILERLDPKNTNNN